MGKKELTMAQALKFARHDFLNELQLILLYIDLGKIAEARQKDYGYNRTDASDMRCWKGLECLHVETWLADI